MMFNNFIKSSTFTTPKHNYRYSNYFSENNIQIITASQLHPQNHVKHFSQTLVHLFHPGKTPNI